MNNTNERYSDLLKHTLLLLFTFGIWNYIWIYHMTGYTNDVKDEPYRDRTKQLLLCILVLFYSVYWTYQTAQRIEKMAAEKGNSLDISTVCLILGIFAPAVSSILLQYEMNVIVTGSTESSTANANTATAQRRAAMKNHVFASGNANPETLLKRAYMFLEDGDWESADVYCEMVLDLEPENASAYLGKLLAARRVSKLEDLKNQAIPFDQDINYQKVLRFGDEELKSTLSGYIEYINDRNEDARKDAVLAEAKAKINSGNEQNCQAALSLLGSISGWRDADQTRELCENKIAEIRAKNEEERRQRQEQMEIAREKAKVAAKKAKKIACIVVPVVCVIVIGAVVVKSVIIPNSKYNKAVSLMEAGEFEEAYDAFIAMEDYKDSPEKAEECRSNVYESAIALMEAEKFEEAKETFEKLNYYKDSEEKIEECETGIDYLDAVALLEAEEFKKAKSIFEKLNDYKDSEAKIAECETGSAYLDAVALKDEGHLNEAFEAFATLGDYKDSAEQADECKFEMLKNVEAGDSIYWGSYEQDGDESNGKEAIEWDVLDVQDGRALVVSHYGLDFKKYNEVEAEVTWETCSLRQWLNSDFVDAAFTADEKAKIPTVTVPADDNTASNVDEGNNTGDNTTSNVDKSNDTEDQVFLLSCSEGKKYLHDKEDARCIITDYAYEVEVGKLPEEGKSYYGTWYMRTPGRELTKVSYISTKGSVHTSGRLVNEGCCIRPAMWIELN